MNQGKNSYHCSFIGLNGADFNSHCLSNSKRLFPETLSPKKHGQVSFDKKGYQDAVLVLFTAKPSVITTANHTGEQISSPSSSKMTVFATTLFSLFGVTYRKIRDVRMKRQALKAKDYRSFWPFEKCRKVFSKINDRVKSYLQK